MKESEKYSSMLKQVETIVGEISSSDIDLDAMVEKVETGYDLIKNASKASRHQSKDRRIKK